MKEFTIDRSKWRCGGGALNSLGEGVTALLNKKGFMCCLGQIMMQEGFGKDLLYMKANPNEVIDSRKIESTSFLLNVEPWGTSQNKLAVDLMILNDDNRLSQLEREKLIIERAEENNIKIKFTGIGKWKIN